MFNVQTFWNSRVVFLDLEFPIKFLCTFQQLPRFLYVVGFKNIRVQNLYLYHAHFHYFFQWIFQC